MSALTNYLEAKILDHVFRGADAPYTAPTTIYAGLFTSSPNDTGGGTEVSGGSYARKSVAFGAAVAGLIETNADNSFATATANWGTITHVGLFDALTGGNLLAYGALNSPVTINNGDTFKFSSGDLEIRLD